MQKEKVIKERISRFDDVFKLTLTLITVALAFASYFFKERGIIFFFAIVLCYLLSLTLWAIGHLKSGKHEPGWKLISWYLLLMFILIVYSTFLGPTYFETETIPFYFNAITCVLFVVGLGAYLTTRKYFSICLTNHVDKALTLWGPVFWTFFILLLILMRP